jgi:hypothetical protein
MGDDRGAPVLGQGAQVVVHWPKIGYTKEFRNR